MCGLIELTKKPAKKVERTLDLQVPLELGTFRCYKPVQIVMNDGLTNNVIKAMWQFLLENKSGEWKASKYTSFNSRWYEGKGFKKSFTKAYRETRCLIPASGFVEGMNKVYHLLKPVDESPIYFGGLFKQWGEPENPVYSASMITIPPHNKLASIHKKAMPLMIPESDINMWLDPSFTNTDTFSNLMRPQIRKNFQIAKVEGWQDISQSNSPYIIKRDV